MWGGQDISLILKALHYAGAGRWRDAPWAVRYPSLPNVMSEHPAWPEFNEILWNDFSDRVGLALGGQSNHPTYPSNMTVATLQRYHSVFAENVLPAAGTHKPETRPGASEEPGQRARETQGKRGAEKPAGGCAAEVKVVANVTDVFYSGQSITPSTLNPEGKLPCIRGPALVATPDALLAFAECRTYTGDHCFPANASASGLAYVCYRRSETGGATWGPLQPLAPAATTSSFNFRAVYSHASKRVIVHFSSPDENVHPRPFGNPNFQVTSTDGKTWTAPESLDAQLGVICGRYMGTLGTGAEDSSGRLFMASYHNNNPSIVAKGRTACLYGSDNGGSSWQVLSYPTLQPPLAPGREAGPWELSVAPIGDGKTLYLNGRRVNTDWGGSPDNGPSARVAGYSRDGGQSFDLRPTTQPAVDPDSGGAHFSLLTVPADGAGSRELVLLAGPAGPAPFPHSPPDDRNNTGRSRMTLWLSDDSAASWRSKTLEQDGHAGYSAMALLPTGAGGTRQAGLLYERRRIPESAACDGSCSVGFVALSLPG